MPKTKTPKRIPTRKTPQATTTEKKQLAVAASIISKLDNLIKDGAPLLNVVKKPDPLPTAKFFQPKKPYNITVEVPPESRTNNGIFTNCTSVDIGDMIGDSDKYGSLYEVCNGRQYGFGIRTTCADTRRLLHVQTLYTKQDMDEWKIRVSQYNEIGDLRVAAAWICQPGNLKLVQGFVLVEIPVGLVYWPLDQFLKSPASLTGSWMDATYNYLFPLPYWRVLKRMNDSNLMRLISNLTLGKNVMPANLAPGMIGILVNPVTGSVDRPVMAPLPPLFMKIPEMTSLADMRKAGALFSFNLYRMIEDNLKGDTGRPVFRTEDIMLKGFVWLAILVFGTSAASWVAYLAKSAVASGVTNVVRMLFLDSSGVVGVV